MRKAVAVLICLGAVCAIYVHATRDPANPPPPPPDAKAAAEKHNRTRNYDLADEFIRWFELQYIKNMQHVAGMSTDVFDSVKALGLDETVERYAALRREILDYAMAHQADETIAQDDLDKIALRQYQHVLANVRSSSKWIDYKRDELKQGVIESQRQAGRVWLPFYRKLLSAPAPSGKMDFRERIRTAMPREAYAKTVEASLPSTAAFYAALKKGVTWYAPWAPMVKRTLDSSYAKDRDVWRATVDQIYGAKP